MSGIAATLAARDYKGGGNLLSCGADALRRLTPLEAERLQGFQATNASSTEAT